MSVSPAYRCLSCRLKSLPISVPRTSRRNLHASPPTSARKPSFPNISASKLGLLSPSTGPSINDSRIKPYSDEEKAVLAKKYTPDQLEAIYAAETAISDEDLRTQGRARTDPMRISYFDDFSKVRPIIDHPAEIPVGGKEEDIGTLLRSTEPVKAPAPAREAPSRQQVAESTDPRILRLSQQTGMSPQQISKLRVKNLVNHRVVNQTRMGKIQSLYFLTIAGNEDGMLGIGEGKAAEDEDGRRQAMMNAIRNMKPVPRYEERTIYGEVEAKVGASVVQLSARAPGFGNRCQHLIYELARAAGIQDLAARTPRSRNKMNVVKAAFEALMAQRLPEDVARARGRKMVDVRKVYYGGQVY